MAIYPDGLLTYATLERAKADPGANTPPPLYGVDRGPALDNPRATRVRDNRRENISERADADADEQPIPIIVVE